MSLRERDRDKYSRFLQERVISVSPQSGALNPRHVGTISSHLSSDISSVLPRIHLFELSTMVDPDPEVAAKAPQDDFTAQSVYKNDMPAREGPRIGVSRLCMPSRWLTHIH